MNYVSLSKIISHALRHEPEKYGLALKEGGWVNIKSLIFGIRQTCPEYGHIETRDVERAVVSSDKKRHEINGEEIRALYGHSKQVKHDLVPVAPPEALYHGTTTDKSLSILKQGIRKMHRQYVHLSLSVEEAIRVAKRRKGEIVILNVCADQAFKDGVTFFESGGTWLCDYIPAKFIQLTPKANISTK